jgi:hypothetical protein
VGTGCSAAATRRRLALHRRAHEKSTRGAAADRRTVTQRASRHRLSPHVDEVRRWRRSCGRRISLCRCARFAPARTPGRAIRRSFAQIFFRRAGGRRTQRFRAAPASPKTFQEGAAAPAHSLSCMREVANRRWVLQSRGDDAPDDPAPCHRAGSTADACKALCCWRACRRVVHVSLMRKLFFSSRRSNWSAVPAIRVGADATPPSRFG